MSSYDRHLEAPYTDQPEGEVCPDCLGDGTIHPPGGFPREECETCGGTGFVDPPTREEIEEVRAEQRFDQLRDEGKI